MRAGSNPSMTASRSRAVIVLFTIVSLVSMAVFYRLLMEEIDYEIELEKNDIDVLDVPDRVLLNLLSQNPPQSWKKSSLGYVIFASERDVELLKSLAALRAALHRRKETCDCYVSLHSRKEKENRRHKVINILESVKFCNLKILEDSADDVTNAFPRPKQFALHWFWTMDKLFNELKIKTDLIFLEDDVVLSPDHREFAVFASAAKATPHAFAEPVSKMLEHVYFVGFGGWGGEHFINADLHTSMIRFAPNSPFPSLAYMINSSFYKLIEEHKDEIVEFKDSFSGEYDWAQGLQILSRKHPLLWPVQLLPTFSRVWHIGSISTIHKNEKENGKVSDIDGEGNVKKWSIISHSPWLRARSYGDLPEVKCSTFQCDFVIKKSWVETFGAPCELDEEETARKCQNGKDFEKYVARIFPYSIRNEPRCQLMNKLETYSCPCDRCNSHDNKDVDWDTLKSSIANLRD